MLRTQFALLFLISGGLGLGACASPAPHRAAVRMSTSSTAASAQSCESVSALHAWSTRRLAALSVVVPVEETELASVREILGQGLGGVILFGSHAPSDLATQITQLRSAAFKQQPVLVMTDEEGGGIQRMANLVGAIPWPRTMGQSMTPSQIRATAFKLGQALAVQQVNMDLAPVADVDAGPGPSNTNPDGQRSFSGDSSLAAQDSTAFMQGLQDAGVLPVLKHFPGLGGSTGNTDVMAASTLPWSDLQRQAIPAFAQAISAGAPAVMISNAIVPGLSSLPAAVSPEIIRGQLRAELNFHGLVITDSLSATALSAAGFTLSSATVAAIKAGADMVIFGLPAPPTSASSQAEQLVTAISQAVATGRLSRQRLESAATHILAAQKVSACTLG